MKTFWWIVMGVIVFINAFNCLFLVSGQTDSSLGSPYLPTGVSYSSLTTKKWAETVVNTGQRTVPNSTLHAVKKWLSSTLTLNTVSTEASLIANASIVVGEISLSAFSMSYVSVYQDPIKGSTKSVKSTNGSSGNFESTYAALSLNTRRSTSNAKEHSSVISSIPLEMKPEIVPTSSRAIILPTPWRDKRHLSTSQTGDKSLINPQGDSMKSDLADPQKKSTVFNLQTAQFSSYKSVVLINSDEITVRTNNSKTKVFTKGSDSLANLPRTFPLYSAIRKTAEFKSFLSHLPLGIRTIENYSVISTISQTNTLAKTKANDKENTSPPFILASRQAQIALTSLWANVPPTFISPIVQVNSSPVSYLAVSLIVSKESQRWMSSTGSDTVFTTPLGHSSATKLITNSFPSETTSDFQPVSKSSIVQSPSYVTSHVVPTPFVLRGSPRSSEVHRVDATLYPKLQSVDSKQSNSSEEKFPSFTRTENGMEKTVQSELSTLSIAFLSPQRHSTLEFAFSTSVKDKLETRWNSTRLHSSRPFQTSLSSLGIVLKERHLSQTVNSRSTAVSSSSSAIIAFSPSFSPKISSTPTGPIASLSVFRAKTNIGISFSQSSFVSTESVAAQSHPSIHFQIQQNQSSTFTSSSLEQISFASDNGPQVRTWTSPIAPLSPQVAQSSTWQSHLRDSHEKSLTAKESRHQSVNSTSLLKHQSPFSTSFHISSVATELLVPMHTMSHSTGFTMSPKKTSTLSLTYQKPLPSISKAFESGVSAAPSSVVSTVQVAASSVAWSNSYTSPSTSSGTVKSSKPALSSSNRHQTVLISKSSSTWSMVGASTIFFKNYSKGPSPRRSIHHANLSISGHQMHLFSSPSSTPSSSSSLEAVVLSSTPQSYPQSPLMRTTVMTSALHVPPPPSSITVFHFRESSSHNSSRSLKQASSPPRTTSLSDDLQRRSSSSSTNQKPSSSISFTASTFVPVEKLKTSSAIRVTSSKREPYSKVTIPFLQSRESSSSIVNIPPGTTVIPTEVSESSTTEGGDISTGKTTTATAASGHIKLLVTVATVPSIVLCVFFAAVFLFRRDRRRRNNFKYSIKLEYRDENNGFRSRCVNSRLDLSLKGIHIDLEFPNSSANRGHSRDSNGLSRGPSMADTPMRELQLLSQECKENLEWISEVIARDMETSLCGRSQPLNRESLYSVREKGNFEPGEKIVRRGSSKRGRETVKWKIPIVRRRESVDFDQTDSMCTDDTTLTDLKNDRDLGRANCSNIDKSRNGREHPHVKEDKTSEDNHAGSANE